MMDRTLFVRKTLSVFALAFLLIPLITVRGGIPFRRGALYHLLSNRTYLGLTMHKGKAYDGQHEAIVDAELFEAVQAKLAERGNPIKSAGARRRVSLLAGMIHDEKGRPMSPAPAPETGPRRAGKRWPCSDRPAPIGG